MFSEEVVDDLEFAGRNELNDVGLIEKFNVNKLDEKLFGHDREVPYWIVFQVVIEPIFGVLFNRYDSIGCKQFLAF
jgi:hypothetical protein